MNKFDQAFRLDGRVAIVTGGATGIGFGIASCLIAAGAKVVLAARRRPLLDEAKEKLGENAIPMELDITDTDHASDFVQAVLKKTGRIDILVNNAGSTLRKPVEEVTQADLKSVMDVNVMGAYALSQAVIPHMKERGSGSIIFISSMASFLSMNSTSPYSIAKSAVLGAVRSMASEVSPFGIRVNSIAPGWIMTPMFEKILETDPARGEKVLGRTPLKQFGTPEDVGWAAAYLASDASRFVTAATLIVDGGAVTGL